MQIKTLFTILSLAALAASPAEASKLKEWFPQIFGPAEKPMLEDPSDTLRVPYQVDKINPKSELSSLKTDDQPKQKNYKTQHRTDEQISKWLGNVTAEILTIDINDMSAHAQNTQHYLTTNGKAELKTYLTNTNLIAIMQRENVSVRAISNGRPLKKNKATTAGYFTWLYEVPMTLTYVPADFEQMSEKKRAHVGKQLKSIEANLLIQVRRTNEIVGEHNVQIELWRKNNIKQ